MLQKAVADGLEPAIPRSNVGHSIHLANLPFPWMRWLGKQYVDWVLQHGLHLAAHSHVQPNTELSLYKGFHQSEP